MVKGQGHPTPLEQRVSDFIQQHCLVSGQRRLLVAVSGGPDSVCLLHILVKLREDLSIYLHVAHLDHRLRGTESAADARYVGQLAGQLGIPCTIEQRDVREYHARQRNSLEEAAREVRYDFLAQVAETIGTDRVAVGHTADDQVETILMHLIRGTGTRGLRGLQPSSHWRPSIRSLTVIRPLLAVSRQETSEYCHRHHLAPRTDSTNLSLSTLRNRIRHQLVPLLLSYNPRVAESLLRAARLAGDDLAFLESETARLSGGIVSREREVTVLNKEGFLALPAAVQRQALRMAVEELLGDIKDIEAHNIQAIMKALNKPAGKKIHIGRGLVFTVEYGRYLIGPDTVSLSPFPPLDREYPINIPGETVLPGWRVTATITQNRPVPDEDDGFTACFDLDKTGKELSLRPRRPADRFRPLGMRQTKKLGEFMIDAKIPRAWRGVVPVVLSATQILWLVGWRIDDRARVTGSTRQILRLSFQRTPDTDGLA